MKDALEYFKEVGLQQEITVTYALAGDAVDGSRVRHGRDGYARATGKPAFIDTSKAQRPASHSATFRT